MNNSNNNNNNNSHLSQWLTSKSNAMTATLMGALCDCAP